MSHKNTHDMPLEVAQTMNLCSDVDISAGTARRMLRRGIRIMASEMPVKYFETKAKYPVLFTKDYS